MTTDQHPARAGIDLRRRRVRALLAGTPRTSGDRPGDGWPNSPAHALPRHSGDRPTRLTELVPTIHYPARAGIDPRWTGSDGLEPLSGRARPKPRTWTVSPPARGSTRPRLLPKHRNHSPRLGDQPSYPENRKRNAAPLQRGSTEQDGTQYADRQRSPRARHIWDRPARARPSTRATPHARGLTTSCPGGNFGAHVAPHRRGFTPIDSPTAHTRGPPTSHIAHHGHGKPRRHTREGGNPPS